MDGLCASGLDHAMTPSKLYLSAWVSQARNPLRHTLTLQVIALVSWIPIAWGIGHAVAAVSRAQPVWLPLGIAVLGLAARVLASWLADSASAQAGQAMTAAARRDIFARVARVGAGQLLGDSAGARASQIVDRTQKLSGYAARWWPGMRLAVIGPCLILVAVATQSWLAAVLLLVSVLVLPVFIWLAASETAATARAQQASLDTLSSAFQSRAAKFGLIRVFRAVARETAQLEAAAETLRERTMKILRVAFLSTAVLEFFASISIALVAVYVGFKLLGVFPFQTGETITLAEGFTVLVLVPEFFAPIRRLASLHHDRADGVAAAGMLGPWLDQGADSSLQRLEPLPRAPVLTFDHAVLAYRDSARPSLPFSFVAAPSRITALAGPSGSGKTSCLLALLGHVELVAGRILVDGQPLQPGESLSRSAAYLRQAPWVTEGTLFENIALARPQAAREEVEAAAREAGVLTFAAPERGGLDQPLARFGGGLSGGQRQKLALARAILRNAPLLLLDEPTAHLDEEAETAFLQLLRKIGKDRTILIATHTERVMAFADEVIDLAGPREVTGR
jgi:ATP-binding cassette subfamily C protein CydD